MGLSIDREKVIKGLELLKDFLGDGLPGKRVVFNSYINIVNNALSLLKEQEPITGETSDGYHTFNELYHHRAVLFSVIVANYPDRAWKSKKHHDGTMYNNMFIVGIDTPDGQATYHYDVEPYWDMFKCRVLDNAPEWDGHTPAQAIERIGKLKALESEAEWIYGEDKTGVDGWHCSECGFFEPWFYEFTDDIDFIRFYGHCPSCGRKMTSYTGKPTQEGR